MKNFKTPKEGYIYRKQYKNSLFGDISWYYGIYTNGKFCVILNENISFLYVFFRSMFSPNMKFDTIGGYRFDDDFGLDSIIIEELGPVQPRWKRILTLGICGWTK